MTHEGGGHDGGGEHEAPLWEKLLGWGNAATHAIGGAAEIGVHSAVHAFQHAGASASEAAALVPGATGVGSKVLGALPWIGTAIGAGQFGYHSHEAANTADNGNYTNNAHWDHVGEATLGAAGAAASWCPPAAMYLGAGELALDGLGAASGWIGKQFGKDTGFSAGSVVGGIEHLASNVSMENHPIINSLMMACPATAPIAMAANMGSLVTGAGGAIDAIGHGIGSAASAVGGAASSAYDTVSSW